MSLIDMMLFWFAQALVEGLLAGGFIVLLLFLLIYLRKEPPNDS